MSKVESHLTKIQRKEKLAETRFMKVLEQHPCYRCHEYGRWTGTKLTCMLPKCVKEVKDK